MSTKAKLLVPSLAALMAAAPISVAVAQSATSPSRADGETVTEVVVTAERTNRSAQTTPTAVSALSARDLERKSVTTLTDLQYATPALSITNSSLTKNVNIRGIGLSSGSPNVVPGVPIYLDWLLQPPIVNTNAFYDIQSVEVYRGPQGTFAGANSTGGALFVTSRSPRIGETEGAASVWAGNYRNVGASGAVNIPMSDTLAARIAFNLERRDSFFDNTASRLTPTSAQYSQPGRLDEKDLRFSLFWKPNEAFTALLKLEGAEKSTGGYDYRPIPGTTYASAAPADLRTLAFDTPQLNDEQALRAGLELRYVLASGVTLRSVTGYQSNKVKNIFDLDATTADTPAQPARYQAQDVSERPFTQEFNIISPSGDRLNWIVGAYYYDDKIQAGLDVLTSGSPHAYILSLSHKKSRALFGRVQYQLTDALQLEIGGRYTRDTADSGGQVQVAFAPQGPFLATIPLSGHYAGDTTTFKTSLSYELAENQFLYAFVAKGAKAGGANGATLFKPETVYSYEAGWKAQWLNRRVKTQLDAFSNSYRNFQIDSLDVTSGNGEVTNAKSAKIWGIEAQTQANLGHFYFDASAAYIHSSVGQTTLVNINALPAGGVGLGPQCPAGTPSNPPFCFDYGPYVLSVAGRSNAYAPRVTYNLGLEYRVSLAGDATLTPRINYAFQGTQWATLLQAPQDQIRSHGIWNAQVTWDKGSYRLVAYGTNITNETYVSGFSSLNQFLGPPRQYGVRLSYEF